MAGVCVVCIAWFFFTSLFYESSPTEYKRTWTNFFTRLRTPIHELSDEQVKENHKIVGAIGVLCMIFGGFVLLMTTVPNSLKGRLAFVFCGGALFLTGWVLQIVSKRAETKSNAEESGSPDPSASDTAVK